MGEELIREHDLTVEVAAFADQFLTHGLSFSL
jgi:hypothetical protein